MIIDISSGDYYAALIAVLDNSARFKTIYYTRLTNSHEILLSK